MIGKGIRIISTGAVHPGKKVTNDDLSQIVDTSDEWIFSRTGIKSRFFCDTQNDESCLSMALGAASKALLRSGISKDEIGCCICATISGDYATPSVACLVQEALSLPEDIPVLDINAACSGFIYGLEVARNFLNNSSKKYGLVIGSEQLSRLLDMTDRSTCVLFGDGSGAAVIELDDNAPYESFLGARGGKAIFCNGAGTSKNYINMDGTAVFKFAVTSIPLCINTLLERSNLSLDDIDLVVCHQANSRIIDHCVKKLKAPSEKFYKDMDHFGNTSAASIPLALNELYEEERLVPGTKLLLVGFGSGLTWGGALITV